jgi:hypothetical protein
MRAKYRLVCILLLSQHIFVNILTDTSVYSAQLPLSNISSCEHHIWMGTRLVCQYWPVLEKTIVVIFF